MSRYSKYNQLAIPFWFSPVLPSGLLFFFLYNIFLTYEKIPPSHSIGLFDRVVGFTNGVLFIIRIPILWFHFNPYGFPQLLTLIVVIYHYSYILILRGFGRTVSVVE